MHRTALGIVVTFAAHPAFAAAPVDYAKLSNAQLIEALSKLDNDKPGQTGMVLYGAFDATKAQILAACPPQPAPTEEELSVWTRFAPLRKMTAEGGIALPVAKAVTPPEVLETIRRGPDILPDLLARLRDKRDTPFVLARPMGAKSDEVLGQWQRPMWVAQQDRYDPRRGLVASNGVDTSKMGDIGGDYTAWLGDIAFVMVGQIVNRDLRVVWSVPTGGMAINIPILTPSLAARTRNDWNGLSREDLRRSLMADLAQDQEADRRDGAFLRLRYYFPASYATLDGEASDRRLRYEKKLCDARGALYPPDASGA